MGDGEGYKINDIFLSVQGEGYHAGRRAVFLRLAGCNALDLGCSCYPHCDTNTDYSYGMSAQGVARGISDAWKADGYGGNPFIVITGGEPSLQVDYALIKALRDEMYSPYIAVETNGSKPLPLAGIQWTTLSPKPPIEPASDYYSEVKVLYPLVSPGRYEKYASKRWVLPLAMPDEQATKQHMRMAFDYCMKNRGWRLTCQMHKLMGLS